MRQISTTVMGLAMVASLTAFPQTGLAQAAPKIAFLAGVVDATYTPAQVAGLKEGTGGDITVFNPDFDPSTQLKQCQDAITSQRYAAIVITPLDNTAAVPCARAAKEAGIPLIADGTAVGKDPNALAPQVDGVVGSVLYPPLTMGMLTWAEVKRACQGADACKIILETSFLSDPLYSGAYAYIGEQAKGTNVKIVATYESQYDPAQTTAKLRDILVANPDVKAIVFCNDPTALAGIRVLAGLGMQDQVKSIAQGGTAAGAEAVSKGELFATLAVLPKTTSRLEGEMALKAIKGQPIDPNGLDAFKIGKLQGAVTKANLDQFTAEW